MAKKEIYRSRRDEKRTKTLTGLILLALGASSFLLSFFSVARTETVIDISFVLEPGRKYGPYENGTYHHTRVISKSTLTGEVAVEGAGVYFTANGYNTEHLRNVFINQNYSFVINPADDLYTFTFDNTVGNTQSSITFTLQERWINILLLIPCLIGLLILVPAGLVLIIVSFRKLSSKVRGPGSNINLNFLRVSTFWCDL